MLRNRIVTLLCAGLAVGVISLVVAAPPKTAGSKKKPADGADRTAEDTGIKDKPTASADDDADTQKKVVKTDAEWKKILTPIQFKVARKKGTEQAFGAAYKKFKKEGEGTYQCICCGQTLFESKTKFDSGTGWPSFYQPVDEKAINRLEDTSDGMLRTEIECSRCDGHLGHVFSDGPPPTGERFCMNYASLKFVTRDDADKTAGAKDKAKDKKPKSKTSKEADPE
jgi:peptide-methionine (R)-S-oxide reductase